MSVLLGVRLLHNDLPLSLLASDTRTEFGGGTYAGDGPKIVIVGSLAIGHVGPGRAGRIIEETIDPIVKAYGTGGKAAIGAVCRIIRQALIDDGFEREKMDGYPLSTGAAFIIAAPCGLYCIGSSFCYDPSPDGRAIAIGSGGDVATGAWAAADHLHDKLVISRSERNRGICPCRRCRIQWIHPHARVGPDRTAADHDRASANIE